VETIFQYGTDFLTAGKALAISRGSIKGTLTPETRDKIRQSSKAVANIAAADKAVYGINTGFGPLCTTMISAEDTKKLQDNILKSHAVGGVWQGVHDSMHEGQNTDQKEAVSDRYVQRRA